MLNFLKQKHWSPYISGVIIGLLQVPLILLLNETLGASSFFTTFTKSIYLFLFEHDAPHTLGSSTFWQIGAGVGIALGAYLSAKLSNTKRQSISPVWAKEFNITNPTVRYVLSFIGGVLLIVGARLSQGCTSGNGITGTAQLSLSSWVVLVAMFGAAIAVAFIMRAVTKGSK